MLAQLPRPSAVLSVGRLTSRREERTTGIEFIPTESSLTLASSLWLASSLRAPSPLRAPSSSRPTMLPRCFHPELRRPKSGATCYLGSGGANRAAYAMLPKRNCSESRAVVSKKAPDRKGRGLRRDEKKAEATHHPSRFNSRLRQPMAPLLLSEPL
jgi:hypothetical protein